MFRLDCTIHVPYNKTGNRKYRTLKGMMNMTISHRVSQEPKHQLDQKGDHHGIYRTE